MKKNLIPIAILTGIGIYYGRKVYLDFQQFKAEREAARQEAKRRAMKAMLDRVVNDITGEDHSDHEHDVRIKVVELDGPPTREKLLASLGEFLDQVPGLDADDKAREQFADLVDHIEVVEVPTITVVKPDNTEVKFEVCTDEGHNGEEVAMVSGVCPDAWQHVTEWERREREAKVIPLPDRDRGPDAS